MNLCHSQTQLSFLEQKYPMAAVEGDTWLSALQSELHLEGMNEVNPANLTFRADDHHVKVTDRESNRTYYLTPIAK